MHRSAAAMEVGLFAPSAWSAATRDSLRILGPAAEERGFSAIWVLEHVATFEARARTTPYGGDRHLRSDRAAHLRAPQPTAGRLHVGVMNSA
jgi:hypothetical protein